MSLEYYITSQTTGDNDTSSQVLAQNTLGYFNSLSYGNFFTYLYPVYTIEGASLDYYGKDYNSISYDITNGKIYTLFFSGESIGSVSGYTGSTLISHNLYKFPYTAYTEYLIDPEQNLIDPDTYLATPLLSIEESVSAITISNSAYTYSFPTLYKDVGSYTQNVFGDKDQFLLDTVFTFEENNDLTLGDAYYIDPVTNLPVRSYLEPSATTFYSSNLGPFEITGNTPVSGTVINGAFFTYFVPPKKPNLYVSGGRQLIAVQGLQSNLSPTFNFANVDDGDYYYLQVNYDTSDTPFTGDSIYTYNINKQVGDAEFVRTYSTPLRANDSFVYRIGNTKEIINIFGNKQAITTWSDTINAEIIATGTYRFSGYTWRNFITDMYDGSYSISGMTVAATTSSPATYYFTTTQNVSMPVNTISATTDGISLVTIEYNGSVNTTDWRNAVYNASGWTGLGIYVVNDSAGTGVTDSSFSFSTTSRHMGSVKLTLYQVYNNTQLDLAIDIKTSNAKAVPVTRNYNSTINSSSIQYNKLSDSDGFFDFGFVNGGYYRLVASPPSPQYAAYEPIDTYITINSNLNLDLVFYIIWGNQNFTFDDLSNETFL